jgi:SAM-dependent methyltransferase
MTTQPGNDPPLSPRATLRWSVAGRLVDQLRPTSVLELGCGLGAVGVRLAKLARYTAAEPDERSWRTARDRIAPLGGTVIHGDHTAVEGGPFDVVCAFEVLEHIEDDAAALDQWLPLVRPGGHLLLSVPADPERFGPSDVLVGHYRRYTAEQLEERLARAGAVEVSVAHYGWPLGYLLDAVRDRLAARRIDAAALTAGERTHTSGRLFQPRTKVISTLIRAGVAPFVALQRARPGHGPGLVALARRPG